MSTRNAPALSLPDRISRRFLTIKDVAPSVVLISFNQNSRTVGYGFENQRIPSAHRPGTEENAGGLLDLISGR
jgi:hypothetical protein